MNRCPGCKACIEGKLFAEFESDEAEEAFWDVHSPDQFPSNQVRLKLRGRPVAPVKRERISMMIHPNLKARLEELAAKRGVGYQTLMHEYLVDRVEAELQAETEEARPATLLPGSRR
ncbi:MAG: CopG family antitoxin [Candidatus Xenobia bacterium]